MAAPDPNAPTIPGIVPGAADTKYFWDDPYVEPKQQHRFGINMPVYRALKSEDTTKLAAFLAKNPHPKNRLAKDSNTSPGGSGKRQFQLRICEYIGYSFTPPTLGFTPGQRDSRRQGEVAYDPSNDTYDVGDVNIELITTLRDDLHWSLNFLFAHTLATKGTSTAKANCSLYPGLLFYKYPAGYNTLVIKEYAPRPEGDSLNTPLDYDFIPATKVIGLHKIKNPTIKSMSFDPFTYGGTDLIKVKLVLCAAEIEGQYGSDKNLAGPEDTTAVQNFYSYEATTGRNEDSSATDTYFTTKGAAQPLTDPAYTTRVLRKNQLNEYPNLISDTAAEAAQTRQELLTARTKTDADHATALDEMKKTMKGGNSVKINELVTKTSSAPGAEAAAGTPAEQRQAARTARRNARREARHTRQDNRLAEQRARQDERINNRRAKTP